MQKNIVKLGIGCILVAVLVARVDFTQTLAALQSISLIWFAFGVLVFFLALLINAIKLGILLPEFKLYLLFRFTMIGLFYSMVLPGQIAGDVVKSFKMSNGSDLARIMSASAFDRMTGQIALLIVTLIALAITGSSFSPFLSFAIVALLVCLLVVTLLPSLPLFNRLVIAILSIVRPNGWLSRLMSGALRFGDIWRTNSQSGRIVGASILLGVVFQLTSVGVVWILGLSMGLEISYSSWIVVVGVMSVIVLLPVTIAGLGLREATIVAMLQGLGVPAEIGLAFSFVILAMYILGAVVGGAMDMA